MSKSSQEYSSTRFGPIKLNMKPPTARALAIVELQVVHGSRNTVARAVGGQPCSCQVCEGDPRCYVCGVPASCWGRYEGHGPEQGGCDVHCGHGNEDGYCKPLPLDMP